MIGVIAMAVISCAGEEPRRVPDGHTPLAAVPAPGAASAADPLAAVPAPGAASAADPLAAVPSTLGPERETAGSVPSLLGAPARPVAVADARAATRRSAHDALAEHCGECHERHRATAQAKALAIFDLDAPDWPGRFDDRRYQVALRRLASKPATARAAFIAFRDAELAASN